MYTQEHYGSSSPMATLYTELNRLTTQYKDFLQQEDVTNQVNSLLGWLNAYQNGSAEAGEYLQEHGCELIKQIHDKLYAAEAEMQRIDEESPGGRNFTGQNAHQLSRATALTADAEKQMHAVLQEQID